MFEKRQQRKAHEAEVARRAALAAELDRAERVLAYAMLQRSETSVPGVVLKRDEHAYIVVEQSGFVEPRRLPGQWTGSSQGVSFRIAKGVSYRVGASKGTYRQGEEVLQPTDIGTFVVTNLRCLFIGSKRTTEWSFAKLVGFSLEGDDGMAVFNVSNRQKASGVLYGRTNEDAIEAVIAAAIAQFQGADVHRTFLGELEEAVADARLRSAGINHNALPATASVAAPLPAAPPELPAPHVVSIPAGWHPDPSGEHQLRYWDGTQWTDHVANRP